MGETDFTDKQLKARRPSEINERWWKAAWPVAKAPAASGEMTAAIKAFKEAQRGKSADALMSSVDNLKATTGKLRAEAASIKFPKKKKAILADLDHFDSMLAQIRGTAARVGSGTRVVYTCNFGAKLKERLDADKRTAGITMNVNCPPVELLEAVVDELDRVHALNMLHAGYDNATKEALDRIFKDMVKLAKADVPQDKKQAAGQKLVDEHLATLAQDWHRVPTDVIRKIGLGAAMESAYQKALTKRRLNIIKATTFTVVSGLAIALPGTTGFAAYVFARTALGLTQQLVEHNMKLTQSAKVLETQLSYLTEAFRHGAALRATSETGATTLNALLGVDLVPTLAKATSNYKDLELNCTHAGFKCRKLTEEIAGALDSLKDLRKAVEKMTGKEREKLEKLIAKSEDKLDELLKKTSSLAKQFNTVDRKLPTLKKILVALGKNSKLQDVANYTAKLLVSLAGVAAGGLADASVAVAATDAASRGIAEVASIANGAVGLLNELRDAHKAAGDL